jgi:putative proteasome-type protease
LRFALAEKARAKAFTTKDTKDTKEKRRKSIRSFFLRFSFVSLVSFVVKFCFSRAGNGISRVNAVERLALGLARLIAMLNCVPDRSRFPDAMTYCVAMNLDVGMVFASDSRTNAGVDNISRFEKMRVFCVPGERLIVALSAGNLSISQNALNQVERQTREAPNEPNIHSVTSLYDAAKLIGDALREARESDGETLRKNNIDDSASFIIGGQIRGEPPRLFFVYAEGNFIEASAEAPFFQSGEIKYGKPVIDRVIKKDLAMADAVKLTLVSFDSTMRSNISVGLPIDLLVYPVDSLNATGQHRIDETDAYFRELGLRWNDGLKQAFANIPAPEWSLPIGQM